MPRALVSGAEVPSQSHLGDLCSGARSHDDAIARVHRCGQGGSGLDCGTWGRDVTVIVITLDEQIAEVKREVAMRQRVYAKQVSAGTLKQEVADRQIARMMAVLATVERVKRLDDALTTMAEPRVVQ